MSFRFRNWFIFTVFILMAFEWFCRMRRHVNGVWMPVKPVTADHRNIRLFRLFVLLIDCVIWFIYYYYTKKYYQYYNSFCSNCNLCWGEALSLNMILQLFELKEVFFTALEPVQLFLYHISVFFHTGTR